MEPDKAASKSHAQRLNRWALMVQDINLRAFVIKGSKNYLADYLTRSGFPNALMEESELENELEQAVNASYFEFIDGSGDRNIDLDSRVDSFHLSDVRDEVLNCYDFVLGSPENDNLFEIYANTRSKTKAKVSEEIQNSLLSLAEQEELISQWQHREDQSSEQRRKKMLENMDNDIRSFFEKDNLGFLNPRYEGSLSNLDSDILKKWQEEDEIHKKFKA